MKFTWKIFISTFFVVLLALSLGGTLLVYISFTRSLSMEKERIYKDNRMMMTEIAVLIGNYNKSIFKNEQDALKSVLASLSENWAGDDKEYRIKNETGRFVLHGCQLGRLKLIRRI